MMIDIQKANFVGRGILLKLRLNIITYQSNRKETFQVFQLNRI